MADDDDTFDFQANDQMGVHSRMPSNLDSEDTSIMLNSMEKQVLSSHLSLQLTDKEQVRLLSLQLKDYRQRLFQEETSRQKMYIEIEKQVNLSLIVRFEQQHNEVVEENKHLNRELKEKNVLIQELKKKMTEQYYDEEPTSPQPRVKQRNASISESPSGNDSQIILSDIHTKLSEILKHSSTEEIKQENKKLKDSLLSLQSKLKQAQKSVTTADQMLQQKEIQIQNLKEHNREQQDQIFELTKQATKAAPSHLGDFANEISALPLIGEADSFLFDQTQNWIQEGNRLPSTRETVADLSKVLDEYNNQGSDKQDLLQKQNEMLTRIMDMLGSKDSQYQSVPTQGRIDSNESKIGYKTTRSDPLNYRGRCETDPSDSSNDYLTQGASNMPRQGSFKDVLRPPQIASKFKATAQNRQGSSGGIMRGSLGLRSSIIGNILLSQHGSTSQQCKPPLRK